MKKRLSLAFTLATVTFGLSLSTSAATKTQCENIARPAGYLTVQTGLIDGRCPTGKAVKYSTPSDGLSILNTQELNTITPRYVVTSVTKLSTASTFKISLLKDNIIACTMPTVTIYNYFSLPYGAIGACRYNEGTGMANSVQFYQFMYVEIARPAGRAGNLRVSLNSKFTGPALNYAIRATSKLNGGSRTVVSTGYVKSGSYTLKDLAPDMVKDAEAGANFNFEVELFESTTSVAKYSIEATGQEMTKN